MQDAELIHEFGQQFKAPGSQLVLADVASGDEFDFDSLKQSDFLVLSTSSWNGWPPQNH